MFPAALLLIGILFLKPPRDRLACRHSVIALAVLLPAGRPAGSESESRETPLHLWRFRQTELRLVCRRHPDLLRMERATRGRTRTPGHPPRRISEAPLILEFRTPVGGTHPLWYDASYWWDGLRVPTQRATPVGGTVATVYPGAFDADGVPCAGRSVLAPLCLLNSRVRKVIRGGGIQNWILILWPGRDVSDVFAGVVQFPLRSWRTSC